MQARLLDVVVGVLEQGDLAVALDPGQGVEGDALEAGGLGRRLQAGDFRVAVHGGVLGGAGRSVVVQLGVGQADGLAGQ